MTLVSAFSRNTDVRQAVEEVQHQLAGTKPSLVVFFASSAYPPQDMAEAMQAAFPGAQTFGCTTAGEIASGQDLLQHSLVALSLETQTISQALLEVLPNGRDREHVVHAFSRFEKALGTSMAQLSRHDYVGLILCDGLAASENLVMDTIGDLTNVFFVGGSAGDDLQFQSTYLFVNGTAYTDGAIALCLLRPRGGYEVIKSQSFEPIQDTELVATKVDAERRAVLEFNHKPALSTYLEALGGRREEAQLHFDHHPIGLMIDGEPWVRGPQRHEGEVMFFYSDILEGMRFSLLRQTDLVKDTREAVQTTIEKMHGASALFNFHCIQRTLALQRQQRTAEYGKIFDHVPTIGFSTYGEQYLGHVNMTSTMLVLK